MVMAQALHLSCRQVTVTDGTDVIFKWFPELSNTVFLPL